MVKVVIRSKHKTYPENNLTTMELRRFVLFSKIAQQKLEYELAQASNVEDFLLKISPLFSTTASDLAAELIRVDFSTVEEYFSDLDSLYEKIWEHPEAVNFTKRTNNDYAYTLYALSLEKLPLSQISLIGKEAAPSFILIVGPIAESTKLTYVYSFNIVVETLDYVEKALRCSK